MKIRNLIHLTARAYIIFFLTIVTLGILFYFVFFHTAAATSGKTILYLHKERSSINQTYNALSLVPPEPATDTATTTNSTTSYSYPSSSMCNSNGNTSDTNNAVTVDATTTGTKCVGTFISMPVGQAFSMSTSDTNAISVNFWYAWQNSKIIGYGGLDVYKWDGTTLTAIGTVISSSGSPTTPTSYSASFTPGANVSFAATDRVVAIAYMVVTSAHTTGGGNTGTYYFDSSARAASQVTLKYSFSTPNKPSLTGSLDDDFRTSIATYSCSTSGVAYSKWICLQGSAASTGGAINAEDTAASGSGDSSDWLWLQNKVTANTATVSNFGTTPSNTFLYQTLPTSYSDGIVRTALNSTATYAVDSTCVGGNSPYSHSGLVLWSSNTDYLEVQVYSTSNSGNGTGGFTNNVNVALNNSGTLSGATSLNPTTTSGLYNRIWLGFQNTGGSWQAQYSTDGATWNNLGSPVSHGLFTRTGLNSFTSVGCTVNSYAGAFEWFQSTLAPPSYNQISYRWFANADSTTPGSPFVAQNTAYTLTSTGQQFRLRTLISTTAGQASVAGQGFDLKYAPLGTYGTCSSIPSTNFRSVDQLGNWSALSNPTWSWRTGEGVLNFNGKIWVLGGHDISLNQYKNDVWYSSDGNTWTQATSSAAWAGRSDMGVAVFNNKMWLIGGSTNGTSSGYVNDVWSSSDGITWTQATAAASWSTRKSFATYSYNSKLWVAGGSGSIGALNDVWSSSDGITWTQATSAANWSARSDTGYTVFNNKVWILGGLSNGGGFAYNDVWSSSDGITWTQATSKANWTPRYVTNVMVLNNEMVMLNGTDPSVGGGLSEAWQSSDGINWSRVASTYPYGTYNNNVGGSYIGAVAYNGNAYVLIGGSSGAFKTNTQPISFYNNPTPADEATITTTANDPTNSGNTIAAQTYREAGGFNNKQTTLGTTTDGEWDFSLFDNGAPAGTTYCFKVVTADDTNLTSYSYYPQITTYTPGPTMDQAMRGGTWFNPSGVKQPKYWAG